MKIFRMRKNFNLFFLDFKKNQKLKKKKEKRKRKK